MRTAWVIAAEFAKEINYPVNADKFVQRLVQCLREARREQAEKDAKLMCEGCRKGWKLVGDFHATEPVFAGGKSGMFCQAQAIRKASEEG